LVLGAEGDDGRARQPLADMAHAAGAAGAGVLLVEDHLLLDGAAAPTVFLRPADAGPAALGQLALPGLALLAEHVFIARAAAKADRLELTLEVVPQPAGDLFAEPFVVRT